MTNEVNDVTFIQSAVDQYILQNEILDRQSWVGDCHHSVFQNDSKTDINNCKSETEPRQPLWVVRRSCKGGGEAQIVSFHKGFQV